MTEKRALLYAGLVFGTLVLTGLMTVDQALEFCRSLLSIFSAISEIAQAA